MSAVDVLKVAEAYCNETDYTVWSDLATSLGTQGLLIQNTDAAEDMKAYNRNLYSSVYQRVGWEAKDNEGMIVCHGFGFFCSLLLDLLLVNTGNYL